MHLPSYGHGIWIMAKQLISYDPLEKMTPEMSDEMERCAR
jgi:hypothetical protein